MSVPDRAAQEARAFQALGKLLDDARACRAMFEEAGAPVPQALLRVLGEGQDAKAEPARKQVRVAALKKTITKTLRPAARETRVPSPRQGALIPPPTDITPPSNVPPEWIPVPIASASPETMVLGVLREAQQPLTREAIAAATIARGRATTEGTIGNVGTALDAEKKMIQRSDKGWTLTDPTGVPVLNGKYVWGASGAFTSYEVAAWRRKVVLHVARLFPKGLTRGEFVRHLKRCTWVKVPITGPSMKADLEWLADRDFVHLVGKKWMPTKKEGEG